MSSLIHNDAIARSLARAVARGDESLESVPGLLRRIITENMWQERILPESAELIRFDSFEDFVTAPPLDGLGTSVEILRLLCKRDVEVLALIDELTKKALPNR